MAGQHFAGMKRITLARHCLVRLAVLLALACSALVPPPALAQARTPVATTSEVRRDPLPVDIPPPPPLSVPAPINRAHGQELYHQAHDALAGGAPDLANRLFEQACRFDEARSCFNIGLDLETRATKPGAAVQLRAAALRAYQTACALRFERGCVATGLLLIDPRWGTPDPARALPLFEAACRRGELEGCEEQADLLYQGEGVAQDFARAAALYRQACDTANRPNSCFNMGLMAERGQGMPRDGLLGVKYYRLACRAGSLAGCHNLAVNYVEQIRAPDRMVLARNLLKQGCNRNYIPSCTAFGQFIREHEKPTDNYAEAMTALTKACDGKSGLACRVLGNMAHDRIGVPGGNQAANRFYDRSCKLGYGEGCYNLGLVYWSGYRVRANPETAMAWFGEGCRLRSASSCVGAYLATLNLPSDHPLAGQDMARRWLALGAAIDPDNNLVKTVQEAYESRKAEAAQPVGQPGWR
jgi:TPR repeat protein